MYSRLNPQVDIIAFTSIQLKCLNQKKIDFFFKQHFNIRYNCLGFWGLGKSALAVLPSRFNKTKHSPLQVYTEGNSNPKLLVLSIKWLDIQS